MKEIAPGLFEVKESMPCFPGQIKFQQYLLPSTLGRAELEEMAARLIEHSINAGQWVGVSWNLILEKIKEDLKNFDKANVELLHGESITMLLLPEFTCITAFGPRFVKDGMAELIREGLVKYEECREDLNKTVFFPTPELIRRIAVAQGLVVA